MNAVDKSESITLEILQAVEESQGVTQRHLANRLGVALGLANSYLKRCIKKGFIKIHQAPANRYLYYLTPSGFAEKSRLTARYLSFSLSFYQKAVQSCDQLFQHCHDTGAVRVLLCGESDLCEIAALRASASGLEVIAVVAAASRLRSDSAAASLQQADAVVVTDLTDPAGTIRELVKLVDAEQIQVPDVLGLSAGFLEQMKP